MRLATYKIIHVINNRITGCSGLIIQDTSMSSKLLLETEMLNDHKKKLFHRIQT